jgi:hypothetical protein
MVFLNLSADVATGRINRFRACLYHVIFRSDRSSMLRTKMGSEVSVKLMFTFVIQLYKSAPLNILFELLLVRRERRIDVE